MKKTRVPAKYRFVPCSACRGQGVVNEWAFSQDAAVCPACEGVGEVCVRLDDDDLALLAALEAGSEE